MNKKILSILIVGLMLVPMMTFGISAHKTNMNEVADIMGDKIPETAKVALKFKWDGKGLKTRYPGVYTEVGSTEMYVKNGIVDLPLLDKYKVTFPGVFMGKNESFGIEYWVEFQNPEEVEQFKKELAAFNEMNIMDRSGMLSPVYSNEKFQEEFIKLVNEVRDREGLPLLTAKQTLGHATLETIKAFENGETKPVYPYGVGQYRGYGKMMLKRVDTFNNFDMRDSKTAKLMAELVFSELQENGGLKSWTNEKFASTWLNIKKTDNGIMFVEIFDNVRN